MNGASPFSIPRANSIQVLWHARSNNYSPSRLYIPTLSMDNNWLSIASGIFYRSQFPSTTSSSSKQIGVFDDTEKLLQSYLSLDIALPELYEHWSKNDSHFKNKAVRFSGVRILRQDPWECLIGFICSSNNNIARISQMVLPSSSP